MNIDQGNPLVEAAPDGSKVMVLFASETGTAEEYALTLGIRCKLKTIIARYVIWTTMRWII